MEGDSKVEQGERARTTKERTSRDKTFGRGASRGRARGPEEELRTWVPVTKLGRLVSSGKIGSLEEIYLHSIPIKEFQIIDYFFQPSISQYSLTEEVMKIKPVQKQTRAGQRTRFKAFVIVGDNHAHIGLGVKCAKEVATAIRGAIISAKLALIPVRKGYWGSCIGSPHTVPHKVSGKCGSVRVKLIPAPRGSMVVGAPVTKKMLKFAGIDDCFSASRGSTRTRGNFMTALFKALAKTYEYLTPDLWKESPVTPSPFEEWSEFLGATDSRFPTSFPKVKASNIVV